MILSYNLTSCVSSAFFKRRNQVKDIAREIAKWNKKKKKTEEKEAVQCAFETGCLARVSAMTRRGVAWSTTGTPFLEPVI